MRALLLALPLLLAGCTAPAIPDDAAVDTYDALPGATLYAWLEPADGYVTVHGVFENDSGRLLAVYEGYHLGSWNLTILDEEGRSVIFNERLSCNDYFYDFLADGGHDEFRFSWTHKEYERFAHCKSGEQLHPVPAAAGNYTLRVGFRIQDIPDGAFQVDLPYRI